VIDVLTSDVEEPETVRDRVLQAAEFIPLEQLGTTDDCGFRLLKTIRRPDGTRLLPKSARG